MALHISEDNDAVRQPDLDEVDERGISADLDMFEGTAT